MISRMALFMFLAAAAAQADTPADPEVKECDSCTARHKSLQALQQARVSSKSEQTKGTQDNSEETKATDE